MSILRHKDDLVLAWGRTLIFALKRVDVRADERVGAGETKVARCTSLIGALTALKRGESDEGWLHSDKSKAFKKTRGVTYESEEQKLRHQVELDDAQIFQCMLQFPVTYKTIDTPCCTVLFYKLLIKNTWPIWLLCDDIDIHFILCKHASFGTCSCMLTPPWECANFLKISDWLW